MDLQIKKATKEQAYLRFAAQGPSGSGKSKSALKIMEALLPMVAPGKRLAAIDSERGSLSKYADEHDFDVIEIYDDYNPDRLHKAFDIITNAGIYGGVIVDSLTHYWNGPGGILEIVDKEAKRAAANRSGGKTDTWSAWKLGDKYYMRLIQKILGLPLHVLVTLRSKQEYVKDDKTSKIEKKGFAPQVREGFEYEMDIEGALDMNNELMIGKSRCPQLFGQSFMKPGSDVATILARWLTSGAPMREKPKQEPEAPKPAEDLWPAAEELMGSQVDASEIDILIESIDKAENADDYKKAKDRALAVKSKLDPVQTAKVRSAIESASKRLAAAKAAAA